MRAYVVEVFTGERFQGNPAGVVLLDRSVSSRWMQHVAAKFGHPATAFVSRAADSSMQSALRWFSPSRELELCGHGTLAAAHVLGGHHDFATCSGTLVCRNAGGRTGVDLSADPPEPVSAPKELAEGLPEVTICSTWRGRLDLLVELASASEVRTVRPEMSALAQVDARGVIVTAPDEDHRVDIVSRFFAPGAGIMEDAVTGSAHATLATWWAPRLGLSELRAEQASARGGMLYLRLNGNSVEVSGEATTVYSGVLECI